MTKQKDSIITSVFHLTALCLLSVFFFKSFLLSFHCRSDIMKTVSVTSEYASEQFWSLFPFLSFVVNWKYISLRIF